MKKQTTAFILGIIAALLIGRLYTVTTNSPTTHPIGYADNAAEVHVHSDFIVYLDDTLIDLSDDKYQTTAQQTKHKHIHLHDNNDDVIHRHDRDITLSDFFASLDFTLSDTCITTDTEETYCTTDDAQLQLYVNGQLQDSIANYENQEEDQILIYYGAPDAPVVETLLSDVTDLSCIYSGTCPERGTAPPESCGLTCEL